MNCECGHTKNNHVDAESDNGVMTFCGARNCPCDAFKEDNKSLDEVFREAQREGLLAE